MIKYARIATPLGTLFATTAAGALTGLYFEGGRHAPEISKSWVEDRVAAPLAECAGRPPGACSRKVDAMFATRACRRPISWERNPTPPKRISL